MHYKVSWKRYQAKVVPRLFATFSQGIDAHSFLCELIQAKCKHICNCDTATKLFETGINGFGLSGA